MKWDKCNALFANTPIPLKLYRPIAYPEYFFGGLNSDKFHNFILFTNFKKLKVSS